MKRLALVALVLTAACGTPATPDRMAHSFAEVFSGLYVTQQVLEGRTDLTPQGLQALAYCQRTGLDTKGPGEDWFCRVNYIDAGAPAAQGFEVQVKPDGCWKADGPPTRQPALVTDARTGRPRTNPLAEFDGCFDTSWGA